MVNDAVDWERVYRESYPSVYRALAATLLDASLAQDALHDAFLEGLRRPPHHQANVAGWIFRVALRIANRSSLRSSRASQSAAGGASMQDELSAVLDRLSVSQLLRLLTQRQRAIVVAFFFLDQSQDQIAELLGVRRGTVAATISQALVRMRKGGTDVS